MEELDLKRILDMFWTQKFKMIIIVLLFAIMGALYSIYFVKPVYSSSTSLLLAGSNNDDQTITTTDITINSKLISTYSELIKSNNIVRKVISNLNLDMSESKLKSSIKVVAVTNTELIKITVTTSEAQKSAEIANEIANEFINAVEEYYKIDNVQVVDKAEVSGVPSNVNHFKDLAKFSALGIVVALAFAVVASLIDTTIKSAEEIEKEFGVPVLASVPLYETNMKKGGRK